MWTVFDAAASVQVLSRTWLKKPDASPAGQSLPWSGSEEILPGSTPDPCNDAQRAAQEIVGGWKAVEDRDRVKRWVETLHDDIAAALYTGVRHNAGAGFTFSRMDHEHYAA